MNDRPEVILYHTPVMERYVPAWDHNPTGVKLIPAWDRAMIDQIIDTATRWAKVNHPITDSFEHFWPMVESDLHRKTMIKLFEEVRSFLDDVPVVIEPFGSSPGGPAYMEAVAYNTPDGDYCTVSFGGNYDEQPYESSDGGMVISQVWFTDQSGDLDIIEIDHTDPARIAAAFRHMWDKHTPKYRNTCTAETCTHNAGRHVKVES